MNLRHAITTLTSTTFLAGAVLIVPGVASASSGGASVGGAATSQPATTTASEDTATQRASSGTRPSSIGFIRLTSSAGLKVRKSPEKASYVGTVKRNQRIRVQCQVNSGPASGKYGTSRIWDRIRLSNGKTGYVADASVENEKNALVAPYCGWPDPGAPATPNPLQGRCSSVASVTLDPAPATRAAFVETAGPLARRSAETTGVPASVTLAQGILESASGTLTAGANNYFGIKSRAVDLSNGIFRWEAQAVGCVHKPTYETEGKRLVRQIGQFRMYRGMAQSFDDHGMFLRDNSRYAGAFEHSDDPAKFARAIHAAGYATDPKYAALLISLINNKTLPLTPYDR